MNSLFTNDDDDNKIPRMIRIVGSAISIGTCILALIIFWLFKDNHNFTMSKIPTLSISNAIFSLSLILPYNSNSNTMCQIQSFLINTFQLTQYFCSCVLCYCTFISVIKKNHLEKHKIFYRIFFSLIELGLPLFLSSVVLYTKSFGDSGGFCWLDLQNRYKRLFMQKLSINIYACLWFLLLLNIFFIIKIFVLINKNKNSNKELYNHLLIYPSIMFITAVPGTMYRLYMILNKQIEIYWMKLIMIICESFCGVLVNCVFMFSPWVRQSIVNACQNIRYKTLNPATVYTSVCYLDNDGIDDNLFCEENEEEEEGEEEEIRNLK